MEWEKAKTILIVLLVLLNLGLFAMGLYRENKYTLTNESVSAISSILQNNGISLECAIPLESRPSRFLNISAASWDYEYITDVFFANETVTRTIEAGNIIYRSADGRRSVTVSNAPDNANELIYAEESASSREPAEYIRLLGKAFESFELSRAVESIDSKVYLYNEKTNAGTVFASSAEVAFLGSGASLRIKKYDFVSYAESVYEIYGADEILLTFLHQRMESQAVPASIEAVQFGYGMSFATREKTQKAKPVYRIFVSGEAEPVYIDAVMNTVFEQTP